ncbi:LysR family transcriptional regulator [Acinetobacter seifertii]|uniref:LysR family transcriptional regulator n=1 Tax=Acinetobacter seifertii TaxID=1530123 RepID=UPI00168BF1EC|nr:LysR family transcriptional regulator [Acinetobacter seifertii]QNX86597.1 LysR family transcriptional regulator [Acinetobacter seifertii]
MDKKQGLSRKIKPLPPMHSLIVFEVVARHLSFSQAAMELNVTQGAISRQIHQLEEYVGKELFIRANRKVHLSPSGLQYYKDIYEALLSVATATSKIMKWKEDHQVTIVTTKAMATLWLMSRVISFREHHEIDLKILTIENISGLNKIDFDIALFYCNYPNSMENMEVTPLFDEEIFPICSQNYLNKLGQSPSLDDLFGKNLLYLDELQKDWISWSEWFEAVGYPNFIPKNRINSNDYPMLLQYAINSQGVVLGWTSLVDEYLNNGSLVRPIETVLHTQNKFCMLQPLHRGIISTSVKKFRNWLLNGQ